MGFNACEIHYACGLGSLAVTECGGSVVAALRDYRVGAQTLYKRAMGLAAPGTTVSFRRPSQQTLDLALCVNSSKLPHVPNLYPRYFVTTHDSRILQTYFLTRRINCNSLEFGVPQARECSIWVGINRVLKPCESELDYIESRFMAQRKPMRMAEAVVAAPGMYYVRPKNTQTHKSVHSTKLPAPDLSQTRWWVPFPEIYIPAIEDSVVFDKNGMVPVNELRSLTVQEVLGLQGLPLKYHRCYANIEPDFRNLLTEPLPFPVISAIIKAIDFTRYPWPTDTPVFAAGVLQTSKKTETKVPWRFDLVKSAGGVLSKRNGLNIVTYVMGTNARGDALVEELTGFSLPCGWKIQIRKRRNNIWDDVYWAPPGPRTKWLRTKKETREAVLAYETRSSFHEEEQIMAL